MSDPCCALQLCAATHHTTHHCRPLHAGFACTLHLSQLSRPITKLSLGASFYQFTPPRATLAAVALCSILFPCFCVSMLLLTACRDPGILPRQEPDADWLANRKPRTRDVVVNGHTLQVRCSPIAAATCAGAAPCCSCSSMVMLAGMVLQGQQIGRQCGITYT
jgi:hypothetical protein